MKIGTRLPGFAGAMGFDQVFGLVAELAEIGLGGKVFGHGKPSFVEAPDVRCGRQKEGCEK